MAYQRSKVSIPTASRPVATEKTSDVPNSEVKPAVTESAPAPQPTAAATAAPAGDSAKRAEDILKLIRSRQAK